MYQREKISKAAERRDRAEELRLIEKAKVEKTKADEQKVRDKKAKDHELELKGLQALVNEKRVEAKEKVTGFSKAFNSKMKDRDQKM